MVKEIILDEEYVTELADLDATRAALFDVIDSLTKEHSNDADGTFVTSPVYMQLQKQYREAKKAFEAKKGIIEAELIPTEEGFKVARWDLNYHSRMLKVEYQPI